MADQKREHNVENASDRAHGALGKGDLRETKQDAARTEAGNSGLPESAQQNVNQDAPQDSNVARRAQSPEGQTSKLSGAGWGSEASGGSVADKRGPSPRAGDSGESEG